MSSPEIVVVGIADSVKRGKTMILREKPDLVFLDIQLSDGTSFEILESLNEINFNVIFTTAYDQYAIKAFQFSAVDYLLKPLDIQEVKQAVDKCLRRKKANLTATQLENLLANMNQNQNNDPILSISTSENIEFVKIKDIIRCEASAAYTDLILRDAKRIVISKVIKDMELLLDEHPFYRIHQSHLINLSEIKKYWKKQNVLEMSDGSKLPIARSRKEGFFGAVTRFRI